MKVLKGTGWSSTVTSPRDLVGPGLDLNCGYVAILETVERLILDLDWDLSIVSINVDKAEWLSITQMQETIHVAIY